VEGSTAAAYSSKPVVAAAMKPSFVNPAWMISRPTALARAMSVPTSRPSHRSAQAAESVRRGSTTMSFAPLSTPRRRWWKKIGWALRAFDPHRTMRSVCSISW